MTKSHTKAEDGTAPVSPSATRHLRLARQAETAPTQAGRFAVPLELHEGTAEFALVPLVLTADDTVALYRKLGTLSPIAGGGAQ
ncbi:hypothetical protein [Streptomyces sp. NPDC093109]|uniref:hypothetical protein n=1 Tax=Streptomyces sp. NPDC093109 TaxID=3154977 RepID=UPI00344BCD8F